MSATAKQALSELSTIGVDISEDVFHVVGFDRDGTIVLRREIKRLALVPTFAKRNGVLCHSSHEKELPVGLCISYLRLVRATPLHAQECRASARAHEGLARLELPRLADTATFDRAE